MIEKITPAGKNFLKKLGFSISDFENFQYNEISVGMVFSISLDSVEDFDHIKLSFNGDEWILKFTLGDLYYSEESRPARDRDDRTAAVQAGSLILPETYITLIENKMPDIGKLIEFPKALDFLQISGRILSVEEFDEGGMGFIMALE